MPILFIDTNAYLNLYGVSHARYPLGMLDSVRDYIFITKQIVDEFNRNKLTKAIQTINGYAKPPAKISVPDLLTDDEESLKQLRQKAQQVITLSQEIEQGFYSMTMQTIEAVSRSEDLISRSLEPIFDRANSPSLETRERARLRREIGNPPGKSEQSLGDQLSWEQLLERVSKNDAVWIISGDADYRVEYKG
jgi:hypothetical protein